VWFFYFSAVGARVEGWGRAIQGGEGGGRCLVAEWYDLCS